MREVNAAIEGALAAGATDILVLDNHGSGNSLPLDLLVPPAKLIQGRNRPTWLPLLDASVAALLFVGQHARAGAAQAHLSHTYSRQHLRCVRLNGREIGEIGLAAGIAGIAGVPAVFISGDHAAVEEAREWIPGIESGVVKVGLSGGACLSRPCGEARDMIRAGVERGLSKRARLSPVVFEGPVELVVDYSLKDSWRAPARSLLQPGSGARWAGWGRLRMVDQNLIRLWDRFIGLS